MTVWSLQTVFVALNVPWIHATVPTRYARNGFILGHSMCVPAGFREDRVDRYFGRRSRRVSWLVVFVGTLTLTQQQIQHLQIGTVVLPSSLILLSFCFMVVSSEGQVKVQSLVCSSLSFVSFSETKAGRQIPNVWLPKPGAIPPLRLFRLFDGSFWSRWRLYIHRTSLNLQIVVVVETWPSWVVCPRVTTNDYLLPLNFRIRKWLKISVSLFPKDFNLLEWRRNKSNLILASIVMLSTELYTA